jgi:hypothetical protein
VAWFGQREHFVLILVLPFLWMTARRAVLAFGSGPALAAGAVAGLGFALKPQYLGVWLAIVAYQVGSRRSLRSALLPEHVGVILAGMSYLAAVIVLAPDYLTLARTLGPVYARYRAASFIQVTGDFGALVAMLALAVYAAYRRNCRHRAFTDVLALAVAGFMLGAVIQAKAFDYHYYPALGSAVCLLLATVFALDADTSAGRRARWVAASLALVGGTPYLLAAVRIGLEGDPEMRAYRTLEQAVGPVRGESILVLAPRSGYAFGLVTYGGARWAARFPCMWIPTVLYRAQLQAGAAVWFRQPDRMGELERWFRSTVIQDARSADPRVVLVAKPMRGPAGSEDARIDLLRYFSSDPGFRGFMEGYRATGESVGYLIFRKVSVTNP